jgi:hypothetical protein
MAIIGVRKLASRAQWTVDRFDVDHKTGDTLGVLQEMNIGTKSNYIPIQKLLHYRTTNLNNDPSGRSILRNAFSSYTYLNNLCSLLKLSL